MGAMGTATLSRSRAGSAGGGFAGPDMEGAELAKALAWLAALDQIRAELDQDGPRAEQY